MAVTEQRLKAASKPSAPRAAIVAAIKAHESELRELGVTSLDLFGSRARGDERPDSDLDVLITYDIKRRFTLYDLVAVGRLLESLTGLTVHVATRDSFRPHRLHLVLDDALKVLCWPSRSLSSSKT